MKTLATILVAAAFGSAAAGAAETTVPKDYPLKKCPVSGEELGSGGMKAYKVTHKGTDVWLCCDHCKPKFDKNPEKFTKAVKDAKAAKK